VGSSEQQITDRRVPVARLRIHNAIVDRLDLAAGDVLVDLGCGEGLTMATAASRVAGLSLIGLDLDATSLAATASWLGELGAAHALIRSDLEAPLPLVDGAATHAVCHDVLECLAQPGSLLAEAHRVLRPGGTAVWSHVDYDSVVVGGADRALTRSVLQAYAEAPASAGRRSDPQMGRRLTAIVARGPLVRTAVDAQALVATDLAGPGGHRINDITTTVRRSVDRGTAELAASDVDRWLRQLREADERGEFFYSQTAYMVVTRRM
jgi:SAM-dependent methyltransferase